MIEELSLYDQFLLNNHELVGLFFVIVIAFSFMLVCSCIYDVLCSFVDKRIRHFNESEGRK